MFKNNQDLKWIVPSIVFSGISILAFLAGYIIGKTETSKEEVTLQDILTQIQTLQPVSSKQLAPLTKQLEEITARIDKLLQNPAAVTCPSSNPPTAPLPSVSSPTSSKPSTNGIETSKSTPPTSPVQPEASSHPDQFKDWLANVGQAAIGLTDYQNFPTIAEHLFKGDMNERIDAIKAIGRLASPEVKQSLFNIVQNESEDLEVRLATIDSLDWKSDATVLINTFRTTDNQGIQDAILNKATTTDFTPATEAALEQNFEEIYQGNLDESMKVSILEFFMEKKPEKVQALLTLVPADKFSPELRKHIELVQSMAKQKLQTQAPSQDATSSSGK